MLFLKNRKMERLSQVNYIEDTLLMFLLTKIIKLKEKSL